MYLVRKKRIVCITLDKVLVAKIDDFGEQNEWNRSQVIESLLSLVFNTDIVEVLFESGSMAFTFSKLMKTARDLEIEKNLRKEK